MKLLLLPLLATLALPTTDETDNASDSIANKSDNTNF